MSKRIAILGSTGSIGCSTLDVIRHLGPPYRATALGAHRQVEKLAAQAKEFSPGAVALADESRADDLRRLLGPGGPKIFVGESGMVDLARHDDVDVVVAAVVGAAGLPAAL
ncbi:MAG: 1-deoxy-D-xylulose-5-phosphate reductoisomerase, partial [Tepidisphaeraceae bacterium]